MLSIKITKCSETAIPALRYVIQYDVHFGG